MGFHYDPSQCGASRGQESPVTSAAYTNTLPRAPRPLRKGPPRFIMVISVIIVVGLGGVLITFAKNLLFAASLLTAILSVSSATIPRATALPEAKIATTALLNERIDTYISRLSQREQIGQLLMLSAEAAGYNASFDVPLQQWHIANVVMYDQWPQPPTAAAMQQFISALQAHAPSPLLIATDEEGGGVDRLAPYYGPTPSARELAATGDPQRAYQQATTDAQHLHDLGINTDLAPLADVDQGGALDASRTFGTTVGSVTAYAGAFLDGLQQHGIVGTLKHWPGLGAANADPDFALPVLSHTQAQLATSDFAAFQQLLSHHPGMIMTTHVIVPAYDAKYPASLSPTLIDGELRGELGYNGVVITDAMNAPSIAQFMQQQGYSDPAQGMAEASVLALLAGNDIIVCPLALDQLTAVVMAVTAAVQSGRISPARLRQSLRRIIRLKVQMGLIALP